MTLDIGTVWKILGVVFACGMVWAKLESIQQDIKRLERKQEKYNQLQERTGSMEYVQTGMDTQIIDGDTVEVPIYEQRVSINKGWNAFDSLEAAAESYGLVYDPMPESIG